MADESCGRCGVDPADGYAAIGDTRYCHGDIEEATCYMLASRAFALGPWPMERLFGLEILP